MSDVVSKNVTIFPPSFAVSSSLAGEKKDTLRRMLRRRLSRGFVFSGGRGGRGARFTARGGRRRHVTY